MRKVLVSLLVACFVALVACGGGKGDSCSDEGEVVGECDEGFVCGRENNDQSGELVCLTQCQTQAQCEVDEDCYPVGKTNLRGCRKK